MGISVFVVDQERTFADALAARLEAEDDVEVVAAVHARTPAQCLIVVVTGAHALPIRQALCGDVGADSLSQDIARGLTTV